MLRNYFKIALRNLVRNKVYSFINTAGLATGLTVAMLIGLWIYDELSYNRYHQNYDRVAQVMQHQTYNGEIGTQTAIPFPLGAELRRSYGSDFKHVLMASWTENHLLTVGKEAFRKSGAFIEPPAPDVLTLNMRRGTRAGLTDPASIMLSESVANALFGKADPMDKRITIDNRMAVKVTGVYEDLPHNSSFRDLSFIAPWDLFVRSDEGFKNMENEWGNNSFQTFVQIADQADMDQVSAKIKLVKLRKVAKEDAVYQPEVFLNPMRQWHLHAEFKNGVRTGGRIEFVWLFGFIGLSVLLLACINFMNLSTARSEKRAKEVGIRKVIGSVRSQLVTQFFGESLLVVAFAFGLALLLVQGILPAFNRVADKQMTIPWSNSAFWLLSLGFSLLTGLLAGSYPALYLSSFRPVHVLKGTFRVGRLAAVPRRLLVVVQFSVSITLIIGTIIVFRQIQHAKDRPVGYQRAGLVMINIQAYPTVQEHFEAVRNELKNSGAVVEVAQSLSPTTEVWSTNGNITWQGKDPNQAADFPHTGVSHEYGRTVGWQFQLGRDFSREYATDSTAFVLNEAAVKFMGLKNPVGEIVRWGDYSFTVIGVIKDVVVDSPYTPVRASIFSVAKQHDNYAILRINPAVSSGEALAKIEAVFKKRNPAVPFDYQFVDEAYAKKFGDEERIGKLASFFAALAIFISCLGLFGLASFVAEQRTKEIGIRKVLGATVFNLWGLLSKDFVLLVLISFGIATPTAHYFLRNWLQKYDYRTDISWWIFALAGAGALGITLLTVSFQAIKAALANPVKSLRNQ